jgi:DNA mismatch repair ATPase MutS
MDSKFSNSQEEIEKNLNYQDYIIDSLELKHNNEFVNSLQFQLSKLRDIPLTIENLISDVILDDIELFEIKDFIFTANKIKELSSNYEKLINLDDFSPIINLLDPDDTKIPSFYIYDSYSEKLAELRKQQKKINSEEEKDLDEKLWMEIQSEETNIRKDLSQKLSKYYNLLKETVLRLASLDVNLSKAILSKELNLNRAKFSDKTTKYNELFNPLVKSVVEEKKDNYQKINIEYKKNVNIITGANMAGKTVVLKSLELAQYMAQFSFFIPAEYSEIHLVDNIISIIGDDQNELEGLSSFASEMMRINDMIAYIKKYPKTLVLIDELARTTNPVEGLAIVNAVASMLNSADIPSFITTHYSGVSGDYRKLRVVGLDRDLHNIELNQNNINKYMDYSLIEDNNEKVPHEALRIASLLGVDKELIEIAKQNLN